MKAFRKSIFVTLILLSLPAFAQAENVALKDVYADYFLIGVAHDPGTSYAKIEPLVKRHFNAITPENHMKWISLQPRPGEFNFRQADVLVDFAERNGMKVIGHALIWHEQTPSWVFEDEEGNPASRELLLERMEEHIKQVVGHFRGRVHGWDVVNEAVDGGELRDNPWRRIIGDDYIAKAFQFAHEADPDAELYYNDYNLADRQKRERVYRLIEELLSQGIRVDGVGMQGHYDIYSPTVAQVGDAITHLASLGVGLHISELDISVYAWDERRDLYPNGLPEHLATQQANRFAELFALFRNHADVIERVTLWGTTDNMSWKNYFPVSNRNDYPLLFDSKGEPKQAFWAIIELD